MFGQLSREGQRCYWSGLPHRCDRYDTKPVLFTIEGGQIIAWYCPAHYNNPSVERSWLNEGWEFAY